MKPRVPVELRGLAPALLALALAAAARAELDPAAVQGLEQRLQQSLAELDQVRKTIADEKIPLAGKLGGLENELIDARKEYETVKRQLDGRSLDMNSLRTEIKSREQEKNYLSSLLTEYVRNLESRLHIAELARYQADLEKARLAPENSNLKPAEVFTEQIRMVEASLARNEELRGGMRYDGRAAGPDGLVKPGTFVLLGPVALFASQDGSLAGVAEQRLGSLEPSVERFNDPALGPMTRDLVAAGTGAMPFDASLGNARKIEETKETLVEHFLKGGAVMWPMLGLVSLIALVALFKWLALSFVRMPGRRQVQALVEAVSRRDREAAARIAARLRGPAGRMLKAGVDHLGDSKELIEETMFERMLETRFRMNRALPFIAVGAACAPLLGLLGTVTGIISTFKLITVFGSGDIKMLSAGISEALITTEFGLYIAIPSLLAHSFLSRKAKALLDRMERLAIEFLTGVVKSRSSEPDLVQAGATAERFMADDPVIPVPELESATPPAGVPAETAGPAPESAPSEEGKPAS